MENKNNENTQKQKNEQDKAATVTRAEKSERMKTVIRELLASRPYKWNEFLDTSAKVYAERFPEETGDDNAVKGRIGSTFDVMEKAGEVRFEANVCSLAAPVQTQPTKVPVAAEGTKAPAAKKAAPKKPAKKAAESAREAKEDPVKAETANAEKKPAQKKRPAKTALSETAVKTAEEKAVSAEKPAVPSKEEPAKAVEAKEEKPEPKKRGRKPKAEVKKEEGEVVEATKPEPKKRGRKPKEVENEAHKAETMAQDTPAEQAETAVGHPSETVKAEEKPARAEASAEKSLQGTEPAGALAVKPEAKVAPVFDMTLLLGNKADKKAPAAAKAATEKGAQKPVAPAEEKRIQGFVSPAVEKNAQSSTASVGEKTAQGPTPSASEKDVKGPLPSVGEKAAQNSASAVQERRSETPVSAAEEKKAEKSVASSEKERPEKPAAPSESPKAHSEGSTAPSAASSVSSKAEIPTAASVASTGTSASSVSSEPVSRAMDKRGEARPAASVALATEVKALAKEAETPREAKKPVLTEFAFLGNAAAKGTGSAPAAKEKEERKPASVTEKAKESLKDTRPAETLRRPEPTKAPQPQPQSQPRQTPISSVSPKAAAEPASQNGRRDRRGRGRTQSPALPATPEEALKAEFLKRLRALGGDYFEYYSVYLLERYSLRNGRRLEGMRVSGGERDGGIDGEITLTDKFGFRETIYIQAKNWDPSKGKEELWVIGETLLQQFIGAVACRQAKEGSRHSRGIFVTTSRFTPEARELLETMADRFIGYDGDDVFEAAKECSFGLKEKDGEWTLDEELLSGGKAFFNLL